jgi:uncharacterized protein YjbI with pentapeptide repeats
MSITAGTIAASAGAWIWERYGKSITDAAVGAIKRKWEKFGWNEAAERYRHRTKEVYGTLRVLGNPKPVPLKGIFTDVFILDKPTAFRRFDIARLEEDPARLDARAKRISGSRLITQREAHRLFILGKPGAGKTTFLKYVAIQAVDGKLDKIPILVYLREWAESGMNLLPYIARQFEICAFPDADRFIEHVLKAGQTIVLFDGLDEISQKGDQRASAIRALSDFSKQYRDSQCLITCRIAATEYVFHKFTYVEIADFTDEQMRAYIHKWFSGNPVKRDKFLEDFDKGENRSLRELGHTPLLLSLLCLAFDEMMAFPRRRVEVYEEALDALLKKWDAARNIRRDETYHKLSLGRKRQMLARIAAETFEEEEYFLRQEALEARIVDYLQKLPPVDIDEDIDGGAVLKAIETQHGVLVERARRIYSFSHLTFQEYFTAKYIVENVQGSALERLIRSHLTDDRWREVFLLTASLLGDADTFFAVFGEAIDELIKDDANTVKMLRLAHAEATTARRVSKPAVARDNYLIMILTDALANATVDDRDRHLARAVLLTLDLAYALDPNLDSSIASDRLFAIVRELARTSNRAIDRDLAHTLVSELARTYKAAGVCDPSFARMLDQKRDVRFRWDLSEWQAGPVVHYLTANLLLIKCLNLAYVSNRAEIEDSLLSAANLREANLEGADLEEVNLSNVFLVKANLRGANLRGANLDGADLSQADLRGANLDGADLRGANLREANLRGADLHSAVLDETTQIDAKWHLVWKIVTQRSSKRDLSGIDLRRAILTEVNLSKADLHEADLREANLSKTNLRRAILTEVNLSKADLHEADLREANLSGAHLSEANLSGADLSGANLSGANLRRARVTNTQLAQAKSLRGARMPDGTKHD